MFDFQKEVIINSADKFKVFYETDINPEAQSNNPVYLHVDRCADYRPEYIVDGKVEGTVGTEGERESIFFSIIWDDNYPTTFLPAGIYKVDIDVVAGEPLADFTQPWSNFSKKISVEFSAKSATSDYGQSFMQAIKKAVINNGIACEGALLEGGIGVTFVDSIYRVRDVKMWILDDDE